MEYLNRNYFFSSRDKRVSKAEQRAKVAKSAQRLVRKGEILHPVIIKGRTIARTFWGKAWCDHLQTYSDYRNRLPLGLFYVRNGSVFELEITKGQIAAQVMSDSLHQVIIKVKPMQKIKWQALIKGCLGKIGSLVGLLQGRCSKVVKMSITQGGIFPNPGEISVRCTCANGTYGCKHIAAVLYSVGAYLDVKPEGLFELRQVHYADLIAGLVNSSL